MPAVQRITAQEAKHLMEANTGLIVDVRETNEFAQSRIPGALNWPLSAIEAGQTPERFADKTKTLLIYCRSGRRSAMAAKLLAERGWTSLYDFGGILDWPYETER